MNLKELPLHWKIIIGMVLGVLFGFLMSNFEQFGKDFISDWIKPFGTIFINALKLIAIPLILASLIKGISDLKDISKLSKMGGITITTYLITTVIAVSVGLAIVNIIKPGNTISDETRIELLNAYEDDADKKRVAAAETNNSGPLQPIIDIVPSNIINAATDNKNMLQIIFFSILFGISMILIPENKAKPLKEFSEWSFLPEKDKSRLAISLYSNQRLAKRNCSRNQRVLKIPDSKVFLISSSHLISKGITRLIIDDSLIAIDR